MKGRIVRLDIDRRRPLSIGRLCWLLRRAGYRVRWLSQVRSPGGAGWHLELETIPPVTCRIEVVALQVVCGSDPAREACNLQRAKVVGKVSRYWRERWNVLYI